MTFLRLSDTSGPALLETGHSDPPPVGSISHVGTDAALEQAGPFSREEIEGIDKVDPVNRPGFPRHSPGSLRNAFQTLPVTADC